MKSTLMNRWLRSAVLAVALGVVPASRPLAAQREIRIPLTSYLGTSLRVATVQHGRDSLRLLLDTGGGMTLLTPDAATRVGCLPFGRVRAHRMTGEVVDFQRCGRLALRFGPATPGATEVGVFDLMPLLPPSAPLLDGVLSLTSFRDQVVTLDIDRLSLVIETTASARKRRRLGQPLPIRVATGNDGSTVTIVVGATVDGVEQWFLLDSGNLAGTLISRHMLSIADAANARPGAPTAVRLSWGTTVWSDSAQVRDLLYDGVLGTNFMRGRAITLDLRAGRAWMSASPRSQSR